MNEKKKMYVMIFAIILFAVIMIGIVIVSNISNQKQLKKIDETMKLEESQIFYLSRPTCHYCVLLEPITDKLKQEYKLTYHQINIENISTIQLKKILKKFDIASDMFGTPYLIITKGGKVIGSQSGYADENVIFNLFQKNGLISSDAELVLNYIDYKTFQTMWRSDQKSIIMIGQTGEAIMKARKNIEKIAKEKQLSISYMDVAETEDDDGYAELLTTIGQTDLSGPIVLIVQNGKIVSETNETSEAAYHQFLKTNGYVE